MRRLKLNITHAITTIAVIALFVNICALSWYIFYGYQALFHSDSAAKVLLAREIIETGKYFPADWNYVNNDLFVLFGHTFIIPLLPFMPAGFTVHAISGLISSALIISGFWFISGTTKTSFSKRIFIVTVVTAGISGFMAENLYGQASYGTEVYFCCYWLYFSIKFINAKDNSKLKWAFALFSLVILAFWANPQRAIITYALPFCAAAVYQLRYEINHEGKKAIWQTIGIIAGGIFIGWIFHVYTLSGVNNIAGAGQARWLSYELMLRNLTLIPKGIIAIFGGLPNAEGLVVSKAGIYEALRLATAFVVAGLIPFAVHKAMGIGAGGLRMIGAFTAFSLTAVIFLQVATSIPDMSDPIPSSRYLLPSLLLGLVVLLMSPLDWKQAPILLLTTTVITAVFATSAYPAFRLSDLSSQVNWGMPGQINPDRQVVIDFLIKNNLNYGYASYWNAGVLSVLSNEKSLVRQIVIDGGIPVPMRWLSSNRWYRPSAWKEKTFLLLTEEETRQIDWDRMSIYGSKPSGALTINRYKIFIFEENIAKHLPGWDTHFEKAMIFGATKYSLHQTGRLIEGVNAEPMLVAEKGETGALHYGPYINVDQGRYVVTFDVLTDKNAAGAARLDVAAAPDQKLYGEKLLKFSNKPQEIIFSLDKTRTMEFRVWALGNERVAFKGVTIKRLSD